MKFREHTQLDRELVLDFFLTLSRIEFALKVTNYAQGNTSRAKPDWDKFGRDIKDHFNIKRDEKLEASCNYYLKLPPQKQIFQNSKLTWVDAIPEGLSDPELLLVYVRRVRNNLFHGGKYNIQARDETERNEELLKSGISILHEALKCESNVWGAYQQASI
jgi:hypothetical protein